MRYLVTGAGGFIGRHLVAALLKGGNEVTAVDLDTGGLAALAASPTHTILQGDFMDGALLDRHLPSHDACFHLAAAHLETSRGSDHFWRVNVDGTLDFARRCHEAGISRFVHCSSVGVFGAVRNPPADEETECYPDIAYEQSKLGGEQAVMDYAAQANFEVVVVRPGWVYGPHCPRTRKLFRSIQKGRFFFVGDGQTLRHPIFVDDIVDGLIVAAAHQRAPGQIFIMAGPEWVTLRELANQIAGSLNVSAPKIRLPYPLVWAGCIVLEGMEKVSGREMPFSRRSLKFFTNDSAFVTAKAREMLGFEAKTSLAAGLAATGNWFSAAGDKA